MLNLKKTAVAVLALGSSAVFAGTMGPVCTAGNVTIPCERTAWDFGIQALYLNPSYSGHGAYNGNISNVSPTTITEYVKNDPSSSWGFKIEGSYHFNTGNDINLNWYHLGGNRSGRTYGAGFISNTPADNLAFDAGFATLITKPSWDAVNLELGQHVDFSEFKNVRLHAGFGYARIKSETDYASGNVDASLKNTYAHSAKFVGFGPRVGADAMYGFANGVGVFANSAAALLLGSSKSNYAVVNLPQNNSIVLQAKRTTLVPELEAKLGINYTFVMSSGDLTFDAGWMWVNYFDAQQLYTSAVNSIEDANFAVNGPFFGAKWIGSVA